MGSGAPVPAGCARRRYSLLADFAPKQLARLKRAEKAPRLLEALQYGFETCYTLYRVSPSRPASGGGLNFELRRQESRFALKWGGPGELQTRLQYASGPARGSLTPGGTGLKLERQPTRRAGPLAGPRLCISCVSQVHLSERSIAPQMPSPRT